MASTLESRLSPELRKRLHSINLEQLSRIPAQRLAERAVPNIDTIELVSANDFSKKYNALYIQEFPKSAERERSDLIVTRIAAQASGNRRGLAPYHIVGILDRNGDAIGAAHFSVLPLKGANYAVPYMQYLYVRPSNRRQDMSEVLHTITLAVTVANAGYATVPFTLFETEPPGYGDDEESRAFSVSRAQVHSRGGAVAVILKRGELEISPHVQPGLEVGEPPVCLIWAIRKSPKPGQEWHIGELGAQLVAAYYQSLRDEGFPEENIKLAEEMFSKRSIDAVWAVKPLSETGFVQREL